ncbi:carbohydrate kinase family protein [Candidatus Gracilibacteria bacterium]|nr:carbohydrate kinase family protein [Candidatus Gracilibacteria bacterium]
MNQSPIVAVIGDVNVDLVFVVPTFPTEGDDVSATSLAWLSGGAGLNIAVALARLGAQVRLIARVGTDPAAEVALQSAVEAGVDLRFVQRDEHYVTGMCTAMVGAAGERTFVCFRGANLQLDAATLKAALADVKLLAVSGHALVESRQRATTLHALALAKHNGVAVALDLCPPLIRAHRTELHTLLPLLRLITLNEYEAQLFLPHLESAQIPGHLLASGAACAALKKGSHGCTLAQGSDYICALPPTVQAIDSTGCGDAFSAALIWGLLHSANLPDCATFANTCGALTATRPGAAAAIPDRQALKAQLSPSLHYLVS